jgi:predicted DNA-binding transcriptional regulator AlpA
VKTFDPCDRTTWPEVITRAQIAAIWQKSEHTIYRLVRDGLFRPMPMRESTRWSKSVVIGHLDRRTA